MRMIKSILPALTMGAVLLAGAGEAKSVPLTVNFDNVTPFAAAAIPSGPLAYEGFTWAGGWAAVNGDTFSFPPVTPNGYTVGRVSGSYVGASFSSAGFGPISISRDTTFDFLSGIITPAWRNGVTLTARGFLGATQTHIQSYLLNSVAGNLRTFNFTGIDRVTFSWTNGSNAGWGLDGDNMAFENLAFDVFTPAVVPLPAALPLFAGGLGLMGLLGWRRKRAAAA